MTHPPRANHYARVKYRLQRQYRTLVAGVGIQDIANTGQGAATPLTFQVFGDEQLLWASQPVQRPRQIQDLRVNVAGVDVLELRVLCPGSTFCAHAVWVEPYLLP